jgi:hypothetical protein
MSVINIYRKPNEPDPELFRLIKETTNFLGKKAKEDNIQKIKEILEDRPQLINVEDPESFESPLSLAVLSKNLPLVKFFIEKGAYIEHLGMNENRPLHHAVEVFDEGILRYLIEKGADVNAVNVIGQTPMMFAIQTGKLNIISLLCKEGGYTYRRDDDGLRADAYVNKAKVANQTKKQIRTILDVCKKPIEKRLSSVQSVLNDRSKMYRELGTFFIPSQKTGQCYSDSFQSTLYYADGFCNFFIEKALEIKAPSEKTAAKRFPVARNDIQAFLEKGGVDSIVQLYLNFTGLRFKNMVESKPLRFNGAKKTLRRRPSLSQATIVSTTGEVCSSVLHMFNSKQRGNDTNAPYRLNLSDIGNLREDAELMFWNSILKKVPASYGTGGIYPYNGLPDSQKKYVVGILISVFPYLPETGGFVGHAISINKIMGQWFMCDDNIGYAIPIQITIDDMLSGTIFYKTVGTTISYYIGDKDYTLKRFGKPRKLFTHDFQRQTSFSHLTEFDFGSRISDDAKIGRSTRKYITWDPKGKALVTDKQYEVIHEYEKTNLGNNEYTPLNPNDPFVKAADEMLALFKKREKLDIRREKLFGKLMEKREEKGEVINIPEDVDLDEFDIRPTVVS